MGQGEARGKGGGGVETTYQNVRDARHLPRVQNQGFWSCLLGVHN